MFEVEIPSISPARFRSVLSPQRLEAFEQGVRQARRLLAGRVVWDVSSTARGSGVAELPESLVAYARGDVRWAVTEGTPGFFAVTKRIHNRCTARWVTVARSTTGHAPTTSECWPTTCRRSASACARATW